MTAERWKRIKQVFSHARSLGGQEQSEYLDSTCGGDQDLRREVESLLRDRPDVSEMRSPLNQGDVTRLLILFRQGDKRAEERLLEAVYDELKRIARANLRDQRGDRTLQPTALVNEAYLKLVASPRNWESRKHFFRVAACAMRQIVVDNARAHLAQKRGGEQEPLPIEESILGAKTPPSDILAMDEALRRLAETDPRVHEVVQLRVFVGLTVEETAEAMGVAPRTVKREWRLGRAWLKAALQGGDIGASATAGKS